MSSKELGAVSVGSSNTIYSPITTLPTLHGDFLFVQLDSPQASFLVGGCSPVSHSLQKSWWEELQLSAAVGERRCLALPNGQKSSPYSHALASSRGLSQECPGKAQPPKAQKSMALPSCSNPHVRAYKVAESSQHPAYLEEGEELPGWQSRGFHSDFNWNRKRLQSFCSQFFYYPQDWAWNIHYHISLLIQLMKIYWY